jgi:thiol-disulfide isomerase/thioredoxin
MDTKKNYLAWTIRILVAFLFLISAIAKLYPSPYFAISTFEVKQLYPLGFTGDWAPYFSRTLIGIEFGLGFLLLQNNYLRKIVIPATILLLLVFVGHLSYVTFSSGGNTGNCGCFGELLPMTPIEAIIKNIIAVGLLGFLYYLLPKVDLKKYNFFILSTIMLASILAIYMIAPIQPIAKKIEDTINFTNEVNTITNNIDTNTVIDNGTIPDTLTNAKQLVTVAKTDTTKNKKTTLATSIVKKDSSKKIANATQVVTKKASSGAAQYFSNIDNQKNLLCYFAPSCDHCMATAKELTEMRAKDPTLPPVSILFMNEEAEKIPDFFKFAGANYPYKIIEIIPFWEALGVGRNTPGIKYLRDGKTIKYYDGTSENKFDGKDLEKQLKIQ